MWNCVLRLIMCLLLQYGENDKAGRCMLKIFFRTLLAVLFISVLSSGICRAEDEYAQEITIPVNNYFSIEMPYAFYEVDKNMAEQVDMDGKNSVLFKKTGDTIVNAIFPVSMNPPLLERIRFLVHVVPQENFSPKDWEKQGQSGYADSASETDTSRYAEEVLELVNVERSKVGARPLRLSGDLQYAASIRAKELTQVFSHDRPDGSSCFTVVGDAGYSTLGENIAAGSATPEAVVRQWMNSPGHKANILNSAFRELGVGYCFDSNGVGGYKHYWVQIFKG